MAVLNSTQASHFDSALSAYGTARSTIKGKPLSPDELLKIDAYWRASLYLCMGMLYLKANPLLREPLSLEHTKPRLLGHWGSDPGQCFTYIHFNRLIKKYDLNAIYISGPGHGAPAVIRNQTDRFSLAIDAIDRMPSFRATGSNAREVLLNQQIAYRNHACKFGIDPPEITNWRWPF